VASILPAASLSDALYGATTASAFHASSLIALVVWAIIFLGAAVFTFKWE
jgi:hypothetical protein